VLIALALAGSGACGKILGIHDSHLRDGGVAGAQGDGSVSDGAHAGIGGATAGAGGAAAGAGGATAGAGGAAAGAGGAVAGAGGAGSAGATAGAGGGAAGKGGAGGGAAGTGGAAGSGGGAGTDAGVPTDAGDGGLPTLCPTAATRVVTALLLAGDPRTATLPGSCEYPGSILPAGRAYAAVGSSLYNAAAGCGACLVVEDLAGTHSAEVQVIDWVPGAANNDVINIEPKTHAMFSVGGNNPMVRVHFAPCSYQNTTIKVAFSDNNYAAALLFDYRTAPTKVEIRAMGATAWTPLVHVDYNRWNPPVGYSAPSGMAALRLTNASGDVVTTDNLAITPPFRDTGRQFPACVVK
jgi:hypothetical protein